MFVLQSASHGGVQINLFEACGLAHKGKATSDDTFNLEDGPEAYTNLMAHTKLTSYVEGAREVYGPEYDPTTQPIDLEVVMRVGGGKKHGRYFLGNGSISSSRNLSQIRAESTSGSPAIRQRPVAAHHLVANLQVICVSVAIHISLLCLQ